MKNPVFTEFTTKAADLAQKYASANADVTIPAGCQIVPMLLEFGPSMAVIRAYLEEEARKNFSCTSSNSGSETWKTPSSDDAGTDPGMVEDLELKKRTLTVTAPDGQLKVVIVSYSFPQDEASKEQPEGGGEEGGG